MPVNLPTSLLRSFVAIVDTGSMLNASEQVFVTQSALSLQIKRLEELVQQQLFHRDGRKLVLTPVGELMLDFARRILDVHDEALLAVSGERFAGPVRVGMVQDFADTVLSGLLSQFSELHPETQIYARVAGTDDLRELLDRGQIDMMIGFGSADHPQSLRTAPMEWFGHENLLDHEVLPLVVLEKPCRFRLAAQAALEENGIPHRIIVETPNLSSLRAAIQGGLGVTVRTSLFLNDIRPLHSARLPDLPTVGCVLEVAARASAGARHLAVLAEERIAAIEAGGDIRIAQAKGVEV